jgi:hypothetical protein
MASPNQKPIELPPGFLDGPAPNLTLEVVDWRWIPENRDKWARVLDGVMTKEECETLVRAVEKTTDGEWERAMVNIGMGMQIMLPGQRNCGRIIIDDREIVAKIWARIAHTLLEGLARSHGCRSREEEGNLEDDAPERENAVLEI